MTSDLNQDQRGQQLFAALRRRIRIIVVCVLLGGAAAFVQSELQTKEYSATAALLFQVNDLSQQLFGYYTSPIIDPSQAASTDLNLVSQPVVAASTARTLGIPEGRVTSEISVAAVATSNLVNVTATDHSPRFAARLANAYAQNFVYYRVQAQKAQVLQSEAQLQQQIAALQAVPAASPELPTLNTRLSQLRVLVTLQTGNVQLAQMAQVPSSQSSPRITRDTVLGIVAGLLIGLLAALVLERLDQRLRDVDEISDTLDLPLLASIPHSRLIQRAGAGGAQTLVGPDMDAFHLLRTQLRYFNVDREIKTVLVASAAPRDGKSTVAWYLARAAAEASPDSRVIIIEADLRAPVLAKRAGLDPAPGLGELLTQRLELEDVTQTVPIRTSPGTTIELHAVVAGLPAPNAAELMESQALRSLVQKLEQEYDFVIFDAPPPSIVPDAISLMTQVDGVLVVVRLKQTGRVLFRQLANQLRELRVHTLGFVLNDRRITDGGYRYGYGYGYGGAVADGDTAAADGDTSAADGGTAMDVEAPTSDTPPVSTS
ncbi:MAG: tyrosine-protein kinase domain-containing protein [Solirubrobacteraceae bacterium]